MLEIQVPIPPSINDRYVNRHFATSKKWKDFKDQVRWIGVQRKIIPTDKPIRMEVDWYPKDNRRDIDSPLKALLDAFEGVAYHNDRQVKNLSIKICAREERHESMVVRIDHE